MNSGIKILIKIRISQAIVRRIIKRFIMWVTSTDYFSVFYETLILIMSSFVLTDVRAYFCRS